MNAGRFGRALLYFVAIGALVFLAGGRFGSGLQAPERIEYSRFLQMVEQQPSPILEVRLEKDKITGELKTGGRFHTFIPATFQNTDFLQQRLVANHIRFDADPSHFSDLMQTLVVSVLFPIGILALFWFFILRQAQSGGNQAIAFGRSRAKRFNENVPKVKFEDVAGVDEAKQELSEVVEFLKNPKKFQALGAKIPRGVLLLGPPGCGKTLLARAIAGEAQVPFFHISGSDFVEMFVGVGASRVRDLFETAKANRPSLIFIDEIDAVGRQRGAGLGGGHDEREQTLNQLLVEMDGFDPNAGVILIAATNRPDVLDPALLRPGRFDRRVVVDTPDANGRLAILQVHVKGKPLAEDVSLDALSRRTPGFSGADLANLVNEAALIAARREKTAIWMEDFEDAIDKVIAGPERRSRIMSDKVKEMVAYHEVGHAIVAHLLPHVDPVHKVSILPRGLALGYTMTLPLEDRYLRSKSELLDEIAYALGGRAAEELVFDELTTGAESDLNKATETARRMVCEYGMSERLGPLVFGRRHGNPFLGRDVMEDRNYSEEVASAIDQEVRRFVDECYERARSILAANRERMRRIVAVLLEKETIEHEEFVALMDERLPQAEAVAAV
ncbi:MAG: ATP-dependent zinc metalloprotease FtsH [Armatimonadota bacterium]|nr:ATP-dependent zinc metalloprotease FtsH [Armatimonadota bacterium]